MSKEVDEIIEEAKANGAIEGLFVDDETVELTRKCLNEDGDFNQLIAYIIKKNLGECIEENDKKF